LLLALTSGYCGADGSAPKIGVCALAEFLTRKVQSVTKEEQLFIPLDSNSTFSLAFKYIRENFQTPLSIKTLAATLGISETHLRRVFHQQLDGITL